ncbi:glycosyltransferase family 4 protein [Chryseosolibacter indicus]|uniref:starch synthase n=1 Tax=Chryseosolibacter indicus TaxID=2782351 RepID=A0ABS5VQG0_9BACT|nr:glycosyltransferase family 4 protein [Chryseosolibacter indicus]MBT1703678.1 glycosyltransferase family 4 protein [Chryseosolibacter indicus]
MKVLMFGWEFPPHISGGLGTACYGLTHSLGKEDVDVLFVVPKLHGDEPTVKTSLINASAIPYKTIKLNSPDINIDSKKENKSAVNTIPSDSRKQDVKPSTIYTTNTGDIISVKEEDNFTYIEIPSGLSAYRAPDFEQHSSEVNHWNYSFGDRKNNSPIESNTESNTSSELASKASQLTTSADQTEAQETQPQEHINSDNAIEESDSVKEVTYTFSGSYGANLLLEVERYAQVAEEIARRFSFDVIHAHDWMTYPAGIAAKEVSGKPLVVHVHATEFDRTGDNVDTRVHAIEQRGMQKADRVVTVSEWTKRIAVNKYNIAEQKVCVVHNGIIPQKKQKVEFKSPLRKAPVVTFLGRVTHQKGPLYFVEAARKVLKEIPDARFIVAGSGDLLPAMIQRVAQLKMSSHFHFTGFLKGNDIQKVWKMSNLYVMPSVSEPFGIAPLEAIQAGVPVIISKQSGVAEVMPHAITVDFWNTNELAESICSVLKYKSLHKTLKKNSKKHIKGITWDNAAKKLNNLYHELIEQ